MLAVIFMQTHLPAISVGRDYVFFICLFDCVHDGNKITDLSVQTCLTVSFS